MNSVLLPIIRRVMPTLIANEIIGVQPMVGPAAGIFGLKNGWYGRVKLTKDHYRYFLQVYNRRTYHHPDYLTSLGYPHVKVSRRDGLHIDALDWCYDNLKAGSWISSHNDFWFSNEEDVLAFKMSCL